jgi:hypothetical protein
MGLHNSLLLLHYDELWSSTRLFIFLGGYMFDATEDCSSYELCSGIADLFCIT